MKLMTLIFVATCLFVTGCAGSTKFESCEPKVCGVDCDPAAGSCSDNELTMSPGGSSTVKATLNVEGSHEGNFRFTVSAAPPLSATVSPTSADVVDGVPVDVIVTLNLDATAMPGLYSAGLDAANADAEVSAGTSITVRVPMP